MCSAHKRPRTPQCAADSVSGGGGIRTHERLATPTVFETAPFNRSGTPPGTQSGADFRRAARVCGKRLDSRTRRFASMQPRGKRRADPARAVLRSPPAAAARAGDRRPGLGRRLPDLADRLERPGGQPGRLRDAAGDRDLRALGAGDAGLVLLVAAAGGAAGGDAGALGRRLRLHLRRADRGGRWRPWPAAARSPIPTRPTCSTTADGRRWRSSPELAGART